MAAMVAVGDHRSDAGDREQAPAGFKFAGDAVDQPVAFLDLSMQVLHLDLQLCQKGSQGSGELVLCVFQDAGERGFKMLAPLAHGDATLEQQSANLVDHRGAAHHPAFTDSVQRLPSLCFSLGLKELTSSRGHYEARSSGTKMSSMLKC
jgi:hypothetical protein